MSDENAEIIRECNALIDGCQSLMLSTLSHNKQPHASYTPFVRGDNNDLFIFISDLASHTKYLETHPHPSVMLIEDEQNTKQIFARTRVIFECTAEFIDRDSAIWEPVLKQFQERFGAIISTLRGLSDFKLVRLTPKHGTFVIGFGQAYKLEGEHFDKAVHIRRNA